MNVSRMSNIEEIVNSLEIKFQKFLVKMEDLQEVNKILKSQMKDSHNTIETLNNEISSLKLNFEAIKATNSLLGSDEYKRDTKLKINSLIRDIEYCIAQLSD
jgi:chromosome segregation ATPase